jgi:lipid II:glycine glycyltransferase (peptidoglycan interpeptide bridge formation enzyme)
MKNRIITDVKLIDNEKWEFFVKNHPNGNIFQSPFIYKVYEETINYKPIGIFVIDSTNSIVGVLVSVIQKEHSGLLGHFSARAITFGGPVVMDDDEEITRLIIGQYSKIIKGKAIYSQFRNLWNIDSIKTIFGSSGFLFEDHLNLIHDLSPSEDELWNIVKSKRRNEIRKAYKEKVVFEICSNADCLKKSYDILKEVYCNAKIPLAKYEFFNNLLKYSSGQSGLKIFTAHLNDKVIGCMLALVYKDIIYDFYAGSYMDYYRKNPNDLIPWEVFKWGKQNGYKKFDFGGAGKPDEDYGVRDYKKKFGGTFVNFGRFEKIHNQFLYIVGVAGYKLVKRFI